MNLYDYAYELICRALAADAREGEEQAEREEYAARRARKQEAQR